MPTKLTAPEIIRLTMPEFKEIQDEIIKKWITLYCPLVDDVKFKDMYEQAVALVVAHKMKLAGYGEKIAGTNISMNQMAGVTSVSEGETSLAFDSSANSLIASNPTDAEYAKTVYGLQFLSLRNQMIMSIVIDGSGVRPWQK